MSSRPSVPRLRQIIERQVPRRFGKDYMPSTYANRNEAPSISIPSIIHSYKFERDIHTLSESETHAALLAFLHPGIFDIHEQKMLSRFEDAHPMAGYPGVDTSQLPPVMGTVDVAERLGKLKWHPMVKVKPQTKGEREKLVAFPYQGDLLLFIEDEYGKYCVNWSVKKDQKGFSSPSPTAKNLESKSLKDKALFRLELEQEYYADAGIRTQRVAGVEIDKVLAANLMRIWSLANKPHSFNSDQREQILSSLQIAFEKEIPSLEVFLSLSRRQISSIEASKSVFYEAIWNRKIRVDWFKPILPDYPLRPEIIDPIAKYGNWFSR